MSDDVFVLLILKSYINIIWRGIAGECQAGVLLGLKFMKQSSEHVEIFFKSIFKNSCFVYRLLMEGVRRRCVIRKQSSQTYQIISYVNYKSKE